MQSKLEKYYQSRKRPESSFEGPSDSTEQNKQARVDDGMISLTDSEISDNISTVAGRTAAPSTSAGGSCDDSFTPNTPQLSSEQDSEALDTAGISEEQHLTVSLSPTVVHNINTECPPLTPPNKRKAVKSKLADKGAEVKFIISIIDEYLKIADTLKHLLNEDSHKLLSDWKHLEDKSKRIAALLFWRTSNNESQTLETLSNEKLYNFDLERHRSFLLKYNYIESRASQTLQENQNNFEDLTTLLTLAEIEKIMTQLKIKFRKCKSKKSAVDKLKEYAAKTKHKLFTNEIETNEGIVLKRLQSTIKNSYVLSDATRRTFDQLIMLMHLGIWSKHSLEDPRRNKNQRPKLKIQAGDIKEKFLVDASIQVDNASIVFRTRDEFDRFQEAYSQYEKYYQQNDKCAFALNILELYNAIAEQDMNRYTALPTWLHRYTPAYIYVEILDDGVDELKKKKKYKIALTILNTLISQVVFLQHCKAEWYEKKANILVTQLKEHVKAGSALIEGLKADLPPETKQILKIYANRIAQNEYIPNELKKELQELSKDTVKDMSKDFDKNLFKGYKVNVKMWAEHESDKSGEGPESYCINQYIKTQPKGQVFTNGKHWQGDMITTMFFLFFSDIIYTKPIATAGIFMGHYQRYPLDMFSESFYTNRKQMIDNELKRIVEMPIEDILKVIEERWRKELEHEKNDISRKVEWKHMAVVLRCLGSQGIAVICRRLARDFGYCYWGFPDITLWNEQTNQVKFVEVKTVDRPSVKQLQWLHYLKSNDIDVAICKLRSATGSVGAYDDEADETEQSDNDAVDLDCYS